MSGLVGFLEARIAEDESYILNGELGSFDMERLLADCRSRRDIIELADEVQFLDGSLTQQMGGEDEGTADKILHALARKYADHPDYDPKMTS